MTEQELEKFRMTEEQTKGFPEIELVTKQDQYGFYSTGWFCYRQKRVLVESKQGLWHLSVAAPHPLGWHELKEIRYKFLPDYMEIAAILPSRMNPINNTPNCYHLFQLGEPEPEKVDTSNVESDAPVKKTTKPGMGQAKKSIKSIKSKKK